MKKSSPSDHTPIKTFASSEPQYHNAFEIFLRCTDQKVKAMQFIDRQVAMLPKRDVFVDVGAGSGILTAHFAREFKTSIAIEPNPSLASELRKHCPAVTVLPIPLDNVTLDCKANFILCSHVLYYLPSDKWLRSLELMASWLKVDGVLALAVQNPDTDCMKMLGHFTGGRFELAGLREEFSARNQGFATSIVTVPAMVRTHLREEACAIAEFMLNLLPMPCPPPMDEVASYVQNHFYREDVFEASCDQDFLLVTKTEG